MADDLRMAVAEVLRKAGVEQADWLREGVRVLAQALMELELERHVGAERHERTLERTGYGNGTRERTWDTRVGNIELQVPRVRDGTFFPSLLDTVQACLRFVLAAMEVIVDLYKLVQHLALKQRLGRIDQRSVEGDVLLLHLSDSAYSARVLPAVLAVVVVR